MARKQRVIANRFTELLAVKMRREGRKITHEMIAAATGLSTTTVGSWARNEVTRFDTPVVLVLCDYFDCGLGDLLVIETVEDSTPEMEAPRLTA